MKVLVGLGNPGAKYLGTRHNVGWLFLDYLAEKFGVSESDWSEKKKLKAVVAEVRVGGEKLLLVKPTTFMNLSGETVVALRNFYELAVEDLVIVYDDVDLAFADLRYREQGSAGTHNGMKSVLALVGDNMVHRLRIGVENRDEDLKAKWNLSDYVLANFVEAELEKLPGIFADGESILRENGILD